MSNEKIEIMTLDNNLRMHIVQIPDAKTSLISVGFHVGSMYEKGFGAGSNDGISHLVEHFFFKGTPTRTTKQVNDDFTRLGADLNAYTSFDHTLYYSKVPTRNLRKAAEIWKDLLTNFKVEQKEFEAEKQVVLQEIKLYADIPELDVNYTVRKKHFKGTPLEHNILGTIASVGNITPEMLVDYKDQYYSANNAILTLVGGGFNLKDEIVNLKNLFEDLYNNPSRKPIYPPKVHFHMPKNRINYFSSPSSKPLCFVALCWATAGINSDDFFPLILLNNYIGNSRTSVFYREIIAKGITSNCRYGFEAYYDLSASIIYFVASPKKIDLVFKKILHILKEVYEMKISSNLIEDLKKEVWSSYLVEIEDPANYGIDLMQKYIKFRKPISPNDFFHLIQVSNEDVERARNNFLDKLELTIYATGTVPKDWNPQFPDKTPW